VASKNTPDTLTEVLKKRGVKASVDSRKKHAFIGSNSNVTFREESQRLASLFTPTNNAVATLGSIYKHPYYERKARSAQRTYEDVYGDVDWTKAAQDDPETKLKLDAAFGNNDSDKAGQGELDQERLIAARGQGKTQDNTRDLLSLHKGLVRAQQTLSSSHDEETLGVRGVDDLSAPIDPIA
jgi:hypothetical protein